MIETRKNFETQKKKEQLEQMKAELIQIQEQNQRKYQIRRFLKFYPLWMSLVPALLIAKQAPYQPHPSENYQLSVLLFFFGSLYTIKNKPWQKRKENEKEVSLKKCIQLLEKPESLTNFIDR